MKCGEEKKAAISMINSRNKWEVNVLNKSNKRILISNGDESSKWERHCEKMLNSFMAIASKIQAISHC